MVSHQAPDSNTAIRALQDSGGGGNVHVTDSDHVRHHPGAPMPGLSNHRPLGHSMLAYTQRMREIAQLRQDSVLRRSSEESGASTVSSSSDVRFQRGPPGLWKKAPQQPRSLQRPLSLDELIGRPPMEESITGVPKKKNRRNSVPNRVPASPVSPLPVLDKDKPRVHISFVSASDLFELVNFSLRSKPSRDEAMKQARYEASLKLMKESDLSESFSSTKTTAKADEAKEDGEDKEKTLAVRGFPSPLDTQKNGQKAKWVSRNADGFGGRNEVSKAPQKDRTGGKEKPSLPDPSQHSPDLLREKHLILLQPQKLRHRPKRAKRMTLHRSLLSAIPEDERRRQETTTNAQAQETPSTRLPIIPTSSSLTAIRSTRRSGVLNGAPFLETKPPRNVWDRGSIEDTTHSNLSSGQGFTRETFPTRKAHRFNMETVENDREPKLFVERTAKKDTIPQRNDNSNHTQRDAFPRRKSTGDKTSSWHSNHPAAAPETSRVRARGALTGQSLALLTPGSRARPPHKKFGKLIFLRDTPDHAYYRYS